MRTHRCECSVVTTGAPEFVDITREVDLALEDSEVGTGHVTVTAPPGCAIVVNEYESGLLTDLKRTLEQLARSANGSKPAIGSTSVVLPATERRLRLGRWQRLLLVELERSADRSITVQIVGE